MKQMFLVYTPHPTSAAVYLRDEYGNQERIAEGPDVDTALSLAARHLGEPVCIEMKVVRPDEQHAGPMHRLFVSG